MTRTHYEPDEATFPAPAYRVKGRPAVAWYVLGWETTPDEDTVWSGVEPQTGRVVCVMVGDDRLSSIDPDDLIPLTRAAFCGGCGQIGCRCDAYEED